MTETQTIPAQGAPGEEGMDEGGAEEGKKGQFHDTGLFSLLCVFVARSAFLIVPTNHCSTCVFAVQTWVSN